MPPKKNRSKYVDPDEEDPVELMEDDDMDNEVDEDADEDEDADADNEDADEDANADNEDEDEDENVDEDEEDENEVNEDDENEDEDEDVVIEGGANEMEDYDSDDDDSDAYKKITHDINKNALLKYHPECVVQNFEEIRVMSDISLTSAHVTLPILTKYERARVIGMRTIQLNNGALPLIPDLPDSLIDNVIISEMELAAKKIPFIICRPFPNGTKEYWKLKDLEVL